MSDLISRQDAIDAFYHIKCNLQMMDDSQPADKMIHGLWLAENAIKQLPSVQPEHKTGRWIKISADKYTQHAQYFYRCDKCGADTIGKQKYCPNCGAKMEVER